jgi:hypothetical protein
MTSHHHDRPRGNADTAAGYLTAAGDSIGLRGVATKADAGPARQVAALAGIGWALLAVCDHLADLADAVTGIQDQVGDVADALADLADVEPPAGKSAVMRLWLRDFLRRHPRASIRVIDAKRAGDGGPWAHGAQGGTGRTP